VDSGNFDSGNSGALRLALVNNMPDAALEDTESQFFHLLESAAGDLPVRLDLYSLPKIPRSEKAQQHLSNYYAGTEELSRSLFDGVIITGTEPRQPNLRNEPYWEPLGELFAWAERNTRSAVLSCLAAHAGVLHSDGIARHPLKEKQFGVFEHAKITEHPLTKNAPDTIRIPHSRWNEVREEALVESGYTILTKSSQAGVDLFVKQKRQSLFVHFQGHPEYAAHTLHKEYRRDVKRFLKGERDTYPLVPERYFDSSALQQLTSFKDGAEQNRDEEVMARYPDASLMNSLTSSWDSSATQIYRNWLEYLISSKADSSPPAAMERVGHS
jgi:homoserine O-succinyltransferase